MMKSVGFVLLCGLVAPGVHGASNMSPKLKKMLQPESQKVEKVMMEGGDATATTTGTEWFFIQYSRGENEWLRFDGHGDLYVGGLNDRAMFRFQDDDLQSLDGRFVLADGDKWPKLRTAGTKFEFEDGRFEAPSGKCLKEMQVGHARITVEPCGGDDQWALIPATEWFFLQYLRGNNEFLRFDSHGDLYVGAANDKATFRYRDGDLQSADGRVVLADGDKWPKLRTAGTKFEFENGRFVAPSGKCLKEMQSGHARITVEPTGGDDQWALIPDPCGGNDCNAHGTCAGEGICTCTGGWTGATCEIDPCDGNTCNDHGTCAGNNVCTCTRQYSGSTCQNGTEWFFLQYLRGTDEFLRFDGHGDLYVGGVNDRAMFRFADDQLQSLDGQVVLADGDKWPKLRSTGTDVEFEAGRLVVPSGKCLKEMQTGHARITVEATGGDDQWTFIPGPEWFYLQYMRGTDEFLRFDGHGDLYVGGANDKAKFRFQNDELQSNDGRVVLVDGGKWPKLRAVGTKLKFQDGRFVDPSGKCLGEMQSGHARITAEAAGGDDHWKFIPA